MKRRALSFSINFVSTRCASVHHDTFLFFFFVLACLKYSKISCYQNPCILFYYSIFEILLCRFSLSDFQPHGSNVTHTHIFYRRSSMSMIHKYESHFNFRFKSEYHYTKLQNYKIVFFRQTVSVPLHSIDSYEIMLFVVHFNEMKLRAQTSRQNENNKKKHYEIVTGLLFLPLIRASVIYSLRTR